MGPTALLLGFDCGTLACDEATKSAEKSAANSVCEWLGVISSGSWCGDGLSALGFGSGPIGGVRYLVLSGLPSNPVLGLMSRLSTSSQSFEATWLA